ncbi:ATP-binding cassette domain-containing protein [Paenibacillaceae bacterium]|nr:ATP-binding cassette domain-containing protein [Paenibacillaceae bacterium]
MIEVKGVSKRYGGKTVVDQVSLTIEKGSITSFIGANGAGKSTLLSMMSRLLAKDTGEIFIDGVEIGRCKSDELARKLSILKQSNHINIRLTVRDLVSFGRFPYSQGRLNKEDLKVVENAMNYMDLQQLQDSYLDQLSGGQRQRAYIAMVLAQDTDYIFLDEPLNNLDMKHSVQIMKILQKLVNELGKTIVLVLHDINFASSYSDYIVALKDGKVIRTGSTDQIIDSAVLQEVYEMDIPIETVNGKKICVYFS